MTDYSDYIGKKVHLTGVGGSSMSGLALLLKERGCIVSGSDRSESENITSLKAAGIDVMIGHCAGNVEDKDLIIHSMAIDPDNIELRTCRKHGIPMMERSVLLGQLSGEYRESVCICGTHGKTTTTSMIAQILIENGFDPTVHIGGVLRVMGGSIRVGKKDLFLTEACEYRRSFMNLEPSGAVILNIDRDHLDCYKDIDDIESSFSDFLHKIPPNGWVLGNGEDFRIGKILSSLNCRCITFGQDEKNDYHISDLVEDDIGYSSFSLYYHDSILGYVKMAVPGIFNVMNAVSALACAHILGADMKNACHSIERFEGAHRRFEKTGMLKGAELFHDYGHNPVEMRNAISIAKKRCNNGKLYVVMQPHTYSRVKGLFSDYLTCTKEADVTLVTDIFGAREADPGDISSDMLVKGMKENGIYAYHTPTFEDAEKFIRENIHDKDVVITLGCGNIYQLNDMLKEPDDN